MSTGREHRPATRRSSGFGESSSVSLAERMGYLQTLRAAFALVVVVFGFFSERDSHQLPTLALITAGYLGVTGAAEAIRRLGRRPGLVLVGGMLLIDGIYLAWAMYTTGGEASALRLLVYVHLIAVTLLASYRTGLKIALWHSLLFFSLKYAESSELLGVPRPSAGEDSHAAVVFTAFWILALATAVFSAVNERELRRRKGDLELLTAMAIELEFATGPVAVAQTLLESVTRDYGFRRGVVLAGRDQELTVMAYRGPGEPVDPRPGLDALVQKAWAGKEPLLVKRLGDGDPRLGLLLPMARNLVAVPMFAEANPIGVLVVEHGEGRIERRLVSLLIQFASHAALALNNAWLGEQVQRLADTDAVTGLGNRRLFAQALEREVARAERRREPVSLAMIDIDHFKKINDEHGHPAGDEVLRRVARAIKDECRGFDMPARYGGEEFAVVLPDCSSRESLRVAERLRKGLSRLGMDFEVTASAGIATFPTHATSPEALLRAADEALYESKENGRDRSTRSRRRPRSRLKVVAGGE
jgi:two-component system, cell cycle response regulator